jgi:hypothetical protein
VWVADAGKPIGSGLHGCQVLEFHRGQSMLVVVLMNPDLVHNRFSPLKSQRIVSGHGRPVNGDNENYGKSGKLKAWLSTANACVQA